MLSSLTLPSNNRGRADSLSTSRVIFREAEPLVSMLTERKVSTRSRAWDLGLPSRTRYLAKNLAVLLLYYSFVVHFVLLSDGVVLRATASEKDHLSQSFNSINNNQYKNVMNSIHLEDGWLQIKLSVRQSSIVLEMEPLLTNIDLYSLLRIRVSIHWCRLWIMGWVLLIGKLGFN